MRIAVRAIVRVTGGVQIRGWQCVCAGGVRALDVECQSQGKEASEGDGESDMMETVRRECENGGAGQAD